MWPPAPLSSPPEIAESAFCRAPERPMIDHLAPLSDPRTFIRLVEMVVPEMRPFTLAKRMDRIRESSPQVFRRLVAILKKAA